MTMFNKISITGKNTNICIDIPEGAVVAFVGEGNSMAVMVNDDTQKVSVLTYSMPDGSVKVKDGNK